jgi:ligand-binding sensor domain-containing protein
MAAFDGVFRFNGKSFYNITSKVSSARFVSVLEDKKGNLWFGSIGSGAFRFDGKSFKNFTTREGLLNNEIICFYEDNSGNIWFGVNGGASRYDGRSFRNYMMNGDSMSEVRKGKTFPDFTRPPDEITSIAEDKKGRYWFGTRGKTFIYDGKKFTVLTHDGKSFTNFRSIIADKKGNVWLGGGGEASGWEGLWRYDGSTFTNFSRNFVDCVYEDKKGNIWTNSQNADQRWVLSRYDQKSLSSVKPTVTEIKSEYSDNRGMVFGILVAYDGNIWLGVLGGVRRYEGNTIKQNRL